MQGEEMIKIYKGDITNIDVDIVVNAANKTLLGGGGVDGAIHRKAGKELLEECKKLGGAQSGEAKITNGYNMPCAKIIHTVGPVYRDGNHNEEAVLQNCYINSMNLAKDYLLQSGKEKISIAFPCIGTGVYHFPQKRAAEIAIETIKKFNYENIDVIFVCFLDSDYQIYQELLKK